jgi:hypothetical protein
VCRSALMGMPGRRSCSPSPARVDLQARQPKASVMIMMTCWILAWCHRSEPSWLADRRRSAAGGAGNASRSSRRACRPSASGVATTRESGRRTSARLRRRPGSRAGWTPWSRTSRPRAGAGEYRATHPQRAALLDGAGWYTWPEMDTDADFRARLEAYNAWCRGRAPQRPRLAAADRQEGRLAQWAAAQRQAVQRAGGRAGYAPKHPKRAAALDAAAWWEWERDPDADFRALAEAYGRWCAEHGSAPPRAVLLHADFCATAGGGEGTERQLGQVEGGAGGRGCPGGRAGGLRGAPPHPCRAAGPGNGGGGSAPACGGPTCAGGRSPGARQQRRRRSRRGVTPAPLGRCKHQVTTFFSYQVTT